MLPRPRASPLLHSDFNPWKKIDLILAGINPCHFEIVKAEIFSPLFQQLQMLNNLENFNSPDCENHKKLFSESGGLQSYESSRCILYSFEHRIHPLCGLWNTQFSDEIIHWVTQGRGLSSYAETFGRIIPAEEYLSRDMLDLERNVFFNLNNVNDLNTMKGIQV